MDDERLLRVLTYSFSPVYDEENAPFIQKRRETLANVINWTKGVPHVAVKLPISTVKKLLQYVPAELEEATANTHYLLPSLGIEKSLQAKHDNTTGRYYLPVRVLDKSKQS